MAEPSGSTHGGDVRRSHLGARGRRADAESRSHRIIQPVCGGRGGERIELGRLFEEETELREGAPGTLGRTVLVEGEGASRSVFRSFGMDARGSPEGVTVPWSATGILASGRLDGGVRRDRAVPEEPPERRGIAERQHLGDAAMQILSEAGPIAAVGGECRGS